MVQAGGTIPVTSEPLLVAIVLLAIPARGDISTDVRAASLLAVLALGANGHLLQFSTVVPLMFTLAFKAGARGADAQHAPVDLKQTEVGSITGLSIA
jgi:hypothetical protein